MSSESKEQGGPASALSSGLDSISSWVSERLGKASSRTKGMLLDDDEKPADEALSLMQERPHFGIDAETKREFAVLDDLEDRRVEKPSEARPFLLQEPLANEGD